MKIVDPYWPYQLIVSPGLRVAIKACVFFAIVIAAFALCGCERPPDGTAYMVAPDGTKVPMIPGHEYEFVDESDTGSAMHKYEGNAAGVGAGVVTESEKVGQSFDATAPGASGGGWAATGGDTSIEQLLTGGSEKSFIAIAGVLIALGGIPVLIWVNRRAGIAMFVLGGGLVGASMLPTWLYVAVAIVLVLVGLVALYIIAERKGLVNNEALRGVAEGVEDLPTEIVVPPSDKPTVVPLRPAVKAAIGKRMDDRDKKTMRKLKKKDDLPPERN